MNIDLLLVAGLIVALPVAALLLWRRHRLARAAAGEPSLTIRVTLKELLAQPERWQRELAGQVASIMVLHEHVTIQDGRTRDLVNVQVVYLVDSAGEPHEIARERIAGDLSINLHKGLRAVHERVDHDEGIEDAARRAADLLGVPFQGQR